MEANDFRIEAIKQTDFLRSFALKLTKNTERAEDLFQDTMLRAMSNQDKFHGGSIRAWMSTIMRNLFINNIRRDKRRQVIPDGDTQEFLIEARSVKTSNLGESVVMIDEISERIDELHPDLRTPFIMCFEGFKYQEIAEKLDAPIGTIKSRIHLARKALKSQLATMYGSSHLAELAT